jgi:1,4-dihydroxy-2-naphthoyl-CoA hydrolase
VKANPYFHTGVTPAMFNAKLPGTLPGLLGMEVLKVSADGLESRMPVRSDLMAPNGFLHAATLITLADTSCGLGAMANLPQGASGFTTVELKSNFLGTTREGAIYVRAVPTHLGRTTQVWDATVTDEGTGKTLALFRCTQMVLWPK